MSTEEDPVLREYDRVEKLVARRHELTPWWHLRVRDRYSCELQRIKVFRMQYEKKAKDT